MLVHACSKLHRSAHVFLWFQVLLQAYSRLIIKMIKQKLVLQAVKALREINGKFFEDSSKRKPLFEDEKETTLYIQVSLRKIPSNKSIKMIKVNLPHRILKDNSEVCLIAGDLDKKNHKAEIEPDVLHYKELLQKHDISHVSEVVTLRQLRTEYKPYEAKQKLLAAYDVFLSDNKITECLPKVLGKHFFKKRKFPIQINMKTSNLKQQVEKALSTKVFYITGHGNSCTCEVAYLDMSDSDISDNVVAMTKALSDQLPGSWDNVMGIYLKTSLSKAIPLYVSYDDPSKVQLEEEDDDDDSAEIDELTTIPNVKVKVYKDGRVETLRITERLLEKVHEMEDAKQVVLVESEKGHKKSKKTQETVAESEAISCISDESNSDRTTVKEKKNAKKLQKCSIMDGVSSEQNAKQVVSVESEKGHKKSKKTQETIAESEAISRISDEINSDSTTVKEKKNAKKLQKCFIMDGVSSEQKESAERSRKLKAKRKREESILADEGDKSGNHTPVQVLKKRKIEGLNMKRFNTRKRKQKK